MVLINKVHEDRDRARARRIAERALEFERVDRVVIGALEGDASASFSVLRRA
jgi:hypothetical protein